MFEKEAELYTLPSFAQKKLLPCSPESQLSVFACAIAVPDKKEEDGLDYSTCELNRLLIHQPCAVNPVRQGEESGKPSSELRGGALNLSARLVRREIGTSDCI